MQSSGNTLQKPQRSALVPAPSDMEKLFFVASVGALVLSVLLLMELERNVVRELPGSCNGILDTQRLLQPAMIHPHLECMGAVGRAMYLDFYHFDFIFPVIYTTFLSGSLTRLWPRDSRVWLVPVLGAVADVLENASTYFLLLKFPQQYEQVELALAVFGSCKYFMLALSAALMVLGGVLRLVRGSRGRKEASKETEKAKAA